MGGEKGVVVSTYPHTLIRSPNTSVCKVHVALQTYCVILCRVSIPSYSHSLMPSLTIFRSVTLSLLNNTLKWKSTPSGINCSYKCAITPAIMHVVSPVLACLCYVTMYMKTPIWSTLHHPKGTTQKGTTRG